MHKNNTYDDHPDADVVQADISDLASKVKINREYDVPYVAGYSKDGKTVYFDYELPKYFVKGKLKVDITGFLLVHELVEKSLIDELGLTYQHAHHIATLAEIEAVEVSGLNYNEYEKFLEKFIKADVKHVKNPPPDLDLTPYLDENDKPLLEKLKKARNARE